MMEELVRVLSETIEPERWAHHNHEPYTTEERAAAGASGGASGGGGGSKRTMKKATLDRYRSDAIIVFAPDFMHRQINGYPKPIRPHELSPAERAERNAKARMGESSITVTGLAQEETP